LTALHRDPSHDPVRLALKQLHWLPVT